MNGLYACDYATFFTGLAGVLDELKKNQFMAAHSGFFCKEMRIIAYSQFLESYKSVDLTSMAHSFGVSAAFLDAY